MFYAPDILKTFFMENQAIAGTFGLNVINFTSTRLESIYMIVRHAILPVLANLPQLAVAKQDMHWTQSCCSKNCSGLLLQRAATAVERPTSCSKV